MTKELDLRSMMVLQNDCQRYSYNANEIDAWKSYTENPLPAAAKARMKLSSEDDGVAALSFLYDHYKAPKEQKMPLSSRVGMYESIKRMGGNTPDLMTLESSPHLMKFLAENISASPEVLDHNKRNQPLSASKQDPHHDDFMGPTSEVYDKNILSSIFDSIILPPQQKWTAESTFKETEIEPLPCEDLYHEPTAPVYSEPYTQATAGSSDFEYLLGSPKTLLGKSGDVPMAYLNKGQFYPITLRATGADKCLNLSSTKVKTVVMAVFENEKNAETQLKCWNHWHSRQPTAKQRVIDIADYKEAFSTVSNIEEVAFNALSFIWKTNDEAKVYIGINCLSTDFSSQKGVKGMPLNLQIDTYDCGTGTNRLIHRAACQMKIFCDKGAERKMRDEERKQSKTKGKGSENSGSKQSVVSPSCCEYTYFKPLDDLVTQPVLFIPEIHYSNMQRCGLVLPAVPEDTDNRAMLKRSSLSFQDQFSPPAKQPKQENPQRVLLYVRTDSEEVFDALMLNSPDLQGLKEAISEKYGLPEDAIRKIYKNCKRGIFVNMDDNIIQHYSNHSAFLMEITEVMGGFHITLREL
ncbi:grainyhead-like protein 3 homolog isoform X1 [Acipenser ruthenus]|nr:grainyhead-like protein 3 homolog isoform X1 [Acipenser ruthenus]